MRNLAFWIHGLLIFQSGNQIDYGPRFIYKKLIGSDSGIFGNDLFFRSFPKKTTKKKKKIEKNTEGSFNGIFNRLTENVSDAITILLV